MARRESTKEDLVRDATAFAMRVELRRTDRDELLFFGRRPDGGTSIYFADEAFYAFNAEGEVRRAYRDGVLYKADRGRLVAMRRARTSTSTVLASVELNAEELEAWTATLAALLADLASAAVSGTLMVERSASDPDESLAAFHAWIRAVAERPIVVAASPSASG